MQYHQKLNQIKISIVTFDGQVISEASTPGLLGSYGGEMRKTLNDLFHPSGSFLVQRQDKELEFQIQIGSKMYPDSVAFKKHFHN